MYTTGLNAPWFFIVLIGQKLMESNNKLKRGLSTRHIRFMALGSAIGTGLFYGSADAIKMAGPSVLLAYIIGGVAAYIIMRALGEMSVHNPAASSFSRYAQENLGPLAGYITGWTYCFEILIVAIADVTAFGIYMGVWFPAVPHWIWVLSVVLIICAINLMSVKLRRRAGVLVLLLQSRHHYYHDCRGYRHHWCGELATAGSRPAFITCGATAASSAMAGWE